MDLLPRNSNHSLKSRFVGDERAALEAVALLHELEEDVALLRAEVQVAHLIDDDDVETDETIEELAGAPVGEGGVHLVEEVLGLHEEAAAAVEERLEEQAGGQASLADAGGADEDDVAAPVDELERGELLNDPSLDTGLAFPWEGAERPPLR